MSLRGVEIREGAVGANIAGDNREFGLLCNGTAVAGKLELNKVYSIRRVSDAEFIGITSEYDLTNKVNIFRHISEFYRRAGEGRKLHILVVSQATLPTSMADFPAKQLIVDSGGVISDMALAFNPTMDYVPTYIDGLDQEVFTAISALQALAEWAAENDMPLHTILECRGLADDISTLPSLRELPNDLHATKVTMVAGQDYDYAESLPWEFGKKYADVGTFLGVIASNPWNRNPGEVLTQNLTNPTQGIFIQGGLSNHTSYTQSFASLETLNDKGFVFPIKYKGTAGFYWNDGHTCSPIILDAAGNINQHTIYYSHTIDESIRALRTAYMPEVKRPVPLDDGKLPQGMIDYFASVGNNVFDRFSNRELISAGETTVDPESDLLIEKILRIQFSVVPTGCINLIKGVINLKSN